MKNEHEPTEEQWKKTRLFFNIMLDILQPRFDKMRQELEKQGVIFNGKVKEPSSKITPPLKK